MTELEAYKEAYNKLKEGLTVFGDRMYTEGHRLRSVKEKIVEAESILHKYMATERTKKKTKKKVTKVVSKD
jgi:hypothetical protein